MNRRDVWAGVALVLVVVVSLALGLWLRMTIAPEWWPTPQGSATTLSRPWMVEADCYSQLARVQRILHGDGLIQNHFKVENWPQGLIPSTTAPFDYVILLLWVPLTLVTKYPLDWAGVLISPALWGVLVLFWALFRSQAFNRVGRCLLIFGSAALPALIWGTAFGRPRHQSLILALMAIGLTIEFERWQLPAKRIWSIAGGIIWGLACWTSLFEPPFVFIALVLFNLIARRRESPTFLISFGVVMLIALALEGVHIFVPAQEDREPLARWLATIVEVQPLSFATFMDRMSLGFLLTPFAAWGLMLRPGDRRADLFLIVLTVLLALLAVVQSRWIYYANLAELLLLVRFCQDRPGRWTSIVATTIFLLGLIVPSVTKAMTSSATASNQPSPQLLQVAGAIDQPGGIMAPWWLSPGLLYFSGQPIVSGSSHCGISGIVDSAKFYSSSSWLDAEQILKKRQVHWVVIYDNPKFYYPVLNTSCGILGLPSYNDDTAIDADRTVAQILFSDRFVPTFLRLRAVTPELKLYEYVPDFR